MREHDKSAADLLEEVGRTLFEGDDWPSRLAVALDVRRDTIRKWLHGRVPFGPEHPVLDRLLALVARRKTELAGAEAELRSWLERNRPPGEGA
jgi:hypothetical protein